MLHQATLLLPLLALTRAQSQSPLIPTDDCPILGPSFPSDFDLSQSKSIKDAIDSFPSAIDALFEAGTVHKNETSFYIDVFSTQTNASIYHYSHVAEIHKSALTSGALDDGTIFRVGSVSKLFTVYTLLNIAGIEVFQHTVTKYLPELKGNTDKSKIIWDEVTVGALASQQGGVGGFPTEISIGCLQTDSCKIEDFLSLMRDKKRPVTPAFQTALYADSGFGILGRVIERITNQTYAEAIQTHLVEPLDLPGSGGIKPSGEGVNALVIPGGFNSSSWGLDNLVVSPSGGIYSNAKDLRTLGLSILQNQLLCDDVVREWMKPRGHTASLTTSLGAPWEIYRLTIPVSADTNRTRVSDLYTKAGGNAGYSATFALSPDHGIGFTVLAAGEESVANRSPLRSSVGEIFIPAAEAAAFDNAVTNYAGTFVATNDSLTNITLTVDKDEPGLGVASLFIEGVDALIYITPGPSNSSLLSNRLYPSGGEYISPSNGALVKQFNAVTGSAGGAPRSQIEGGIGLFDDGCVAWENVGFFSTNLFELEVVEGKATAVRSPDVNITMTRLE